MPLLDRRACVLVASLVTAQGCQLIGGLDDYAIGETSSTGSAGATGSGGSGNCDPMDTQDRPPGAPLWTLKLGDSAPQAPWAVASDRFGSVVVVGDMGGSMTVGETQLVNPAFGADAFVVKIDVCGRPLWGQLFGGPGDQQPRAVAIAPAGEVFVVGQFQNSIAVGPTTLTAKGKLDMFVAKLLADGSPAWAVSFGGVEDDFAYDVDVNGAGDLLAVSGGFGAAVEFGGQQLGATGVSDAIVLMLDPGSGAVMNRITFAGSGNESAPSVAFDESGALRLVVNFDEIITIGPVPFTTHGAGDIAVAKLGADGSHQWSKAFGGAGGDFASRVIVSGNDTIFAGVFFSGSIDFGGGALPNDGFLSNGYATRLDDAGAHVTSRHFGGPGVDVAGGMAADPADGSVLVAGICAEELETDFGPPPNCIAADPFLVRVRPDGQYGLATAPMYGPESDGALEVALTPGGHPVLVGYLGGELHIGDETLSTAGGADVFITRFVR